jgi:hypothetical protein
MPRLAAAAALLLALTACSNGGGEPEADVPTATPTPLADLATDSLALARESFCARVAPAAVEDALGAPAEDAEEWVNGDRTTVAPGVTDVVHEFGCRWRAADGTAASAWVFAPPVTRGQAAGLRRDAVQAEGCREVAGAPAYGSPSVAVRCTGDPGDTGGPGGATTTFHGLFGDAWLSCTAPTDDLAGAGRWCVSVAQAATA